jgi:elongation factor Ts
MGGKVGALLAIEATTARGDALKTFADNTAMHIAAMSPRYLSDAEVDADDKAKQAEIYDAQLREEGKPDAVRGKIVEGKIQTWIKEMSLLDQFSVLDSEKTIRQIQDEISSELGGVKLTGFLRYERGEGIEKKQDDFAAEAQRMAQG